MYEEATGKLLKEQYHPLPHQQQQPVKERIVSRRTKLEPLSGQHEQEERLLLDYPEPVSLSTASTLQMSDTWRSSKRRMFSEKEKKKQNQQQQRSEKEEESITGGFARVRKLSSRWLNDLFGSTTTPNSNGSGGQRVRESLSNDVTTFECDNYNSNNDIMTTLNVGAIPKQKKKVKVRTEEEVEEDLEEIINMEDVTGMNELANYLNLKGEQQQPQKSNSFWVSSRSSSSRCQDAVLPNRKGALRSYNNNKQRQKKKTVFPSNYNCNSSRVNLPGGNDNYSNKDGPAKEEGRQRDAGVAMKRDFSSNTSSSSDGRKYEALSLHPSLLYYHQSPHCYPEETVDDKDAGDLLHLHQQEQQLPRNSSSTRHQKHEGSYYCHYQHEEERFHSSVQGRDKGQEGRQADTPTPAALPSVASTTAGRKYGDMQTKVEEQQQQNYNHRRRQKQQRHEKSSGRSCRSTRLPGHANMSDCDNSSGGDEGGNNNNNNNKKRMIQEENGGRIGGDSRQLNTCNNNNGQSFSRGNKMVQVDEKKPKQQQRGSRRKKKTKKGKDKDSFDEDNNTCRLLDAPADGYLSVESSELDDVEGGGADNYGDSFDEDVEEGNNNERLKGRNGEEEEELQYFINHNNINQRDQVRSRPEDRGSSGWFARSLGKSRVVNKNNGLSGSDDNSTKKFYYSKIEIRE